MKIKIQHDVFRLTIISTLMVMPWKVFSATCTVSANPPLSFGVYDPGSAAPLDGVGGVRVRCTAQGGGGLVSYSILMSSGTGAYASRQMLHGTTSNVLTYNLYTNSSHTTIWGDGTASTSVVSDSYQLNSGSKTTDYPAYGRIFTHQNVRSGSYSDSITITVNY
ncbi:Csu type fimbrial protein [Hydrogenovibrio kuenenii]|uniref:Csu type fimbrial protein n=1 Tax=Hydrogenovibrio kuenenii TaxID=63658 RepID=UPI0004647582|nr:spore coat U domain-containing protein [Hydrogenovibrio kuenenii]